MLKLPKTWRLLYQDGGNWRPVETNDSFVNESDQPNTVRFTPVRTKAVRLQIDHAGAPCGIQEWVVD